MSRRGILYSNRTVEELVALGPPYTEAVFEAEESAVLCGYKHAYRITHPQLPDVPDSNKSPSITDLRLYLDTWGIHAEPEFNEVKDSGDRTSYSTGAVRDKRTGKGRFDLIPPIALRRLAKHYENGAIKYGDNNWRKGIPLKCYIDSAFRHLTAVMEGKSDEDHVTAVIWNMIGYMWTLEAIRQGQLPKELEE